MNETKVNTNNSDFTTSEAKNNIFAREHAGVIDAPYGSLLINSGDAVDHAVMRGRQLTSLLMLIQGDGAGRFRNLGPARQESLLWLAVQLSEEMEAMVDMIEADALAKSGGAQ